MTITIIRDKRGRGSKWRDSVTGQWIIGPTPKEGVKIKQGRKIELQDDYVEKPPELPDVEFFRDFDVEIEFRAEGT